LLLLPPLANSDGQTHPIARTTSSGHHQYEENLLHHAIKAIEEAIPGSGQGEAKLAAIRAIMEAANGQIGIYWPLIQTTIGVLVGLFNKTGSFQKAA
jgi:hypothetical protein